MRPEKQYIVKEYFERLNKSPYFIVVDYSGMKVAPLTELRRRLAKVEAEMHIVKNTLFRIAAKEAGVGDIGPSLAGQLAVVTGKKDISAAAKVIKTFAAEFERPKIKFGYLNNQRLETDMLLALADLPSIEVLRAQLLGVLKAPMGKLVSLLNEPASRLVRVMQAKAEKGTEKSA
ncbi:MAG: 50S ribosomal protein L10 [Verrucomicrobiia bacterium]|jgi:large subunit ribosomal protein L10